MPENSNFDNFDDLLPPYTPPEDVYKTEVTDGTLTAEAIGYTSLSRDIFLRENNTPLAHFNRAWGNIEFGLTAPEATIRQGFLDIAEQRLDMVLEDSDITKELRLRAILARVAIPSFRARAEQAPLTEELQHATYHHLAKLITSEATNRFYDGLGLTKGKKGLVLGSLCESLVYAVLLRSGDPSLFPFPAAPREDKGSVTEQNHDLYIPYKDTKVPIQVKRNHRALSNEEIVNISLVPHIQQAINKISFPAKTRKSEKTSWATSRDTCKPDVLLGRYLDPNHARYSRRSPVIAERMIDMVSKSVGESVREQMARIIRVKKASGQVS